LLLALAALWCVPVLVAVPALHAQGAPRVFEGRVSRPGPTPEGIAVRDAMVTLHRVGPDAQGPIDSLKTDAAGRYRFQYRATGDSNAVYFASTSRGGVSYFTPPTREPSLRGGMAEILVFDTTSAPIPITVRGRHVIITAPDTSTGRTRTVIEAFELSNDSTLTRVARGTSGVTFDAALPKGVTAVAAGQGDISSDAIAAVDGRVRVNAPLAPGLKQVTFSYEIPTSSEPFELLIEQPVTVLEVLVEDPGAIIAGAGLIAVDPVQIEGRPFKRFLAENATAASTVAVTIPPRTTAGNLRLMLIVTAVGAAMLLGLGMVFARRGPGAFARARTSDPEVLALEIAALDTAFERIASPTEQQRAEHYVARAQLKGRLSAALAKRDGLR